MQEAPEGPNLNEMRQHLLRQLRNAMAHGLWQESQHLVDMLCALGAISPDIKEGWLVFDRNRGRNDFFVFPAFVRSLLKKFGHGRVFERALDPCAGVGLLLADLVESGLAKHGTGVIQLSDEWSLAKAIASDLPIDWIRASPIQWLPATKGTFDLIVGGPPIGMKAETSRFRDESGNAIEVRDEVGRLVLLESALRLTADGLGLFIVHHLDARDPENGVYHNLHRFGLSLDGFFALPESPFSPLTQIAGGIAVICRRANKEVFVGKFAGDAARDAALLVNYQKRKVGADIGLGSLVKHDEFRGWFAIESSERVKSRARRIGYPPILLSALTTAVNSTKAAEPPGYEDIPNSVYLPTVGRSPARSSIAELTLKPHNYLQLVIDPGQALAPYLAEFFNTPLGLAIREDAMSGFTIPKITRSSLENTSVYVPPIAAQAKILETSSRIRNVRNEVQELESRLWAEPRKIDDAVRAIDRYTREESFTEWLDRLPFPLASILWVYHTAGADQKRRYEHLMHFFEALAQFLATVLLSAAKQHPETFATERHKLLRTLREQHLTLEKGSFGTWKCAFEQLAKSFRTAYAQAEGRAAIEQAVRCHDEGTIRMLTSSELVAVLQRCNGLRNTWYGHTGVVGDRDASERHRVLKDELSRVRDAFGTHWEHYALVLPGNNSFSLGEYRYTLMRVMGRCAPFEQFKFPLAEALEDGYLHLLADDEQKALPLIPLVRVMPSPNTEENACYFYNRQQPDGIRFVSYHFESEADIVKQFPDTNAALSALSDESDVFSSAE